MQTRAILDVETDRLQAHFEWVLSLLRAQNRPELDASGLAHRARTLEFIADYANRGEFPRNTATRTRMLPAFVDNRGVHCAVANLMDRTAAQVLASRIQATMNLSYIEDMLGEMSDEMSSWAETVGLTPDEVALIQPSYCPEVENPCTYYAETSGCSAGGGGPGSECDECTLVNREDGDACFLQEGVEGVCEDVTCAVPYDDECVDESCAPGEEVPADTDCTVHGAQGASAGPAAVLAALFVLSLTRRARRP